MSALRAFWAGLALREQRVLLIGATVLGLIVLWLAVWEPLRDARDAARVRVVAGSTDLAMMRSAAAQLRELGGSAAPGTRDTRSLLALVDATARSSSVGDALLRVEPVAGDQVRVYFEGVSFDALMQWLDELEAQQGVNVSDLSVNRAAGTGRVDARLVLQREGG